MMRPLSGGVTILSERPQVAMITAPNPGPKTLDGTHTYFVGASKGYIIDPGPNISAHLRTVISWLARNMPEPHAILLSHGHPDHASAATELTAVLGLPIWASAELDVSSFDSPPSFLPFGNEQCFDVDSDVLSVIATPGHSRDHVAFWLEGARILFSGDTILGHGTTLIASPEGNMAQYLVTLANLLTLQAAVIAPGHGPPVTDPATKIRDYIEHRRQREKQILAALSDGPARVPELVTRLYADVDPRLHDLAAASVTAQLEKLGEEGRVAESNDRYSLM